MVRSWLLLGVVLACLVLGCGGSGDRGKNKFADRPVAGGEGKPK